MENKRYETELDSLIGVISLLLLSEKNRSILEAMTKKRPETMLFHTASGIENTGFLKLTSKPLTGHSNSSLQSCCVVFFVGFDSRNQGVLSVFYLLRRFTGDCIVILMSHGT